jgi:hypothetical protein
MKIKLTYNLTILVIDKWLIWQWEICIHQLPVGYDISPLKRVKFKILTTGRQASG